MSLTAGCGGGGTGPGQPAGLSNTVVIGKVVSQNGTPVPGASVVVANAINQSTTLQGGDYRLTAVPSGVQTIQASTTIGNVVYTGSSQVLAIDNQVSSNAMVMVSPHNVQGSIGGTITDINGHPIFQARVFLAVPVVAPVTGTPSTVGVVAFADTNGHYRFPNVPSGSGYSLTASVIGFQNATFSNAGVQPGQTTTVNMQLIPSFNQIPPTPTMDGVLALTQPSSILTPSIRRPATQAAASSVYDAIRRAMSPKYAKLIANRHAASQTKRITPHATSFGPYAIEVDVFFSGGQSASLSGFRIYNSSGSAAPTPYDFLQDPQANLYLDFDPAYVPDQFYNFAVSAVNTDGTETQGISATATVQPLELLTVTNPAQGRTVANPLTVNWQGIQGVGAYGAFVYNTYPTLGAIPVAQVTNLSSSTTSYTFPGTFSPGNYWLVVAASDPNQVNVSVSQIVPFQM